MPGHDLDRILIVDSGPLADVGVASGRLEAITNYGKGIPNVEGGDVFYHRAGSGSGQ